MRKKCWLSTMVLAGTMAAVPVLGQQPAEQQVMDLANADRAQQGLPPLKWDPALGPGRSPTRAAHGAAARSAVPPISGRAGSGRACGRGRRPFSRDCGERRLGAQPAGAGPGVDALASSSSEYSRSAHGHHWRGPGEAGRELLCRGGFCLYGSRAWDRSRLSRRSGNCFSSEGCSQRG